MKADTTRSTFKQAKHYNGVRMQQGRVQLDADWNEQLDITDHRVETEAIDVIGHCGAPMHFPGFHVVKNFDGLSVEEQTLPENQSPPVIPAGDLLISGGRYYVDGILCENEKIVRYTQQPDLPDTPAVTATGTFLAYIDVWSRNITALDDPAIREVALGGPDTATRSKTVWQVKIFRVGNIDLAANCSTPFVSWNAEIAAGTGRLAARAEPGAPSSDPCIVSPGAGYRRLENQHYRVEVHDEGVRGKATFKWSRDNGSIVTKWESQTPAGGNELTVGSIGRDKVLNFAAGQWIELIDDTCELLGKPGTLVQLVKAEGNVLTIDPATALPPGPINITNFPRNPMVRRWDMVALIKPLDQSWINLEDGVQVQFTDGTYKTGDFWLIPARTATADVEWPIDPSTNLPATQLPFGILHHYCRLAVLKKDAAMWTATDCRHIFPPLTELISFFYAGGDGQEAMPNLTLPNQLTLLAKPLEAGVTNGEWPVAGATVQFTAKPGNGKLQGNQDTVRILTGADGVARCTWSLEPTTQNQQVEALLLDDLNKAICYPIHYNANLSVASQVAYDPAECPGMMADNVINVQDAIDHLCKRHQGCCDVTVGPGGQFELLDEAIESLRKDGKTDICICLLPGEHILLKGLFVEGPGIGGLPVTNLKISGCGMATRIKVGDFRFPLPSFYLRMNHLASFTLKDVAVYTQNNPKLLACESVGEVRIENCHLSATSRAVLGAPSLVTIQDAKYISVSDSYLSSYSLVDIGIFNQLSVEPPVLFSTKPLSSTIDELEAPLGKATPAVRNEFVKPYQEYLKADEEIPNKARGNMEKAIATILENDHESTDGQARYPFPVSYLVYGRTLVLMDAKADTLVENNRFSGPIMLYGNGAEFSAVDWRTFARKIIDGTVTLTEPKATLQIRNNSLTGISVDRSVGSQQPTPFIPNLYGGCLLAENWCYSSVYQVLANHVNTTANQFNYNLNLPRDVGTVAGGSAIIVGNSAPNVQGFVQSILFYAVPSITLPGGGMFSLVQISANLLAVELVT